MWKLLKRTDNIIPKSNVPHLPSHAATGDWTCLPSPSLITILSQTSPEGRKFWPMCEFYNCCRRGHLTERSVVSSQDKAPYQICVIICYPGGNLQQSYALHRYVSGETCIVVEAEVAWARIRVCVWREGRKWWLGVHKSRKRYPNLNMALYMIVPVK